MMRRLINPREAGSGKGRRPRRGRSSPPGVCTSPPQVTEAKKRGAE